jgi:hypothetical protein
VPPHLLWRRQAVLHILIAMAIAMAAGPEIMAAMEMTTLLELLGASLFLTAFATGAKLAVSRFLERLLPVVLPARQWLVLRSDASAPVRVSALLYVAAHAAWCFAFVFILGAWGHFAFKAFI